MAPNHGHFKTVLTISELPLPPAPRLAEPSPGSGLAYLDSSTGALTLLPGIFSGHCSPLAWASGAWNSFGTCLCLADGGDLNLGPSTPAPLRVLMAQLSLWCRGLSAQCVLLSTSPGPSLETLGLCFWVFLSL